MAAGLFLDLDGTLADSLGVMREAYDRFLAERGSQGSDAGFAEINGPPLPQVISILRARHGFQQPENELLSAYRDLVESAYVDVRPNRGAGDLLAQAARAGWPVAVVTSNSEVLAGRWLARHDLASLVRLVVGRERAGRGKPYPDPYLTALTLNRCDAGKSWAVEDSPQGARAALEAGLNTLVLAHGAETWPDGARPIAGLDEVWPRISP